MRVIRTLLLILLVAGSWRMAPAAEKAARELLSPSSALVVEIRQPLDAIENPLIGDIWELLCQTRGVKQALNSPGIDRFRQAGRFIEKSLGVDWRTGINRLTTGGIVFAVEPQGAGAEPTVTVIVTADGEQTVSQFMESVQAEIRRAAASRAASDAENAKSPTRPSSDVESTRYRSFTCHRAGNGHYALAGRQLLVSNSRRGLEAALDRLADADSSKPFDPPASLRLVDSAGKPPLVQATVNLKLLKEDPKAQAALTIPANDPAPVFLLGGYLDLLRRADFAAAGVFVSGPTCELKVRIPVGADGAAAGLSGYFASETTVSAPRLLRPAGTIFSAGWFRDYNKLWDARGKLLSSEIISRLEAVNAKAQAEGAKVGPVDLAEMLGPHFRFVVSRPGETAYQVKLDNRLPALALIVSVRDAARFRQRVLTAVDRLLWLGVASNNLGQIKPSEYRGATISTLHFNERPDFTDSEKRVLYNFDPSYSLTRDELIVGSTSEIVRNVIDELDRQAALPQALGATQERLTDHQELSFVELAEYFKEFVPHFVQQAVLNRGLSTADAEKEIAVLRQILLRMAGLTSIASIARNHFEISIRVGPVEEER